MLMILTIILLMLDMTLSHISMYLKVIHHSGGDIIVCLDLNSLIYNRSLLMHSCMPLDYQVKLMYMASTLNYYAFVLDILTPIINKFANVSLETNRVLNDWKLSRVTPIFKGKGDVNDKRNYRPISVISHIAKIIEREVKHQMCTYIEH